MPKPRARSPADQSARDRAREYNDSRYIGDDCPDHPGGLRLTSSGRCVYCHREDEAHRRGSTVKPENAYKRKPKPAPEIKLPVAQSEDGWIKPLTKEQLMRGK